MNRISAPDNRRIAIPNASPNLVLRFDPYDPGSLDFSFRYFTLALLMNHSKPQIVQDFLYRSDP